MPEASTIWCCSSTAVYCAIGFCCVHVIAAARSSSSARRRGGSDSELACMGSLRRALPLGIRNERLVLCTVFRVTRFFFATLFNHRHFWAYYFLCWKLKRSMILNKITIIIFRMHGRNFTILFNKCVKSMCKDWRTKMFPCLEIGHWFLKNHYFHLITMKLGENDQLMSG